MENLYRGNPERHAQEREALNAKPFEILTNQVPESAILQFMEDRSLVSALVAADWPVDEKTCDAIGKRLGMGAEQVAAVAKYQRGIMVEKEGPLH